MFRPTRLFCCLDRVVLGTHPAHTSTRHARDAPALQAAARRGSGLDPAAFGLSAAFGWSRGCGTPTSSLSSCACHCRHSAPRQPPPSRSESTARAPEAAAPNGPPPLRPLSSRARSAPSLLSGRDVHDGGGSRSDSVDLRVRLLPRRRSRPIPQRTAVRSHRPP